MINLLPPFARKQITLEYWVRVIGIGLFLLALVTVLVMIMLVPVYINLTNQVSSIGGSVADAEQIREQIVTASESLQTANQLAVLLVNDDPYQKFTTYFFWVEEAAGNMVQIEEVLLNRRTDDFVPMQVTAVAETRQNMIQFIENLQSYSHFGQVDIPISSLAQSENIRFSVQVPILIPESI